MQVSVTPQAPSFFGKVDVAKDEVKGELERRFQESKSLIPKSNRKGFRPVSVSREEAEAQLGPMALYGSYWRTVFLRGLQIELEKMGKLACFVDGVNVMDRGICWETNAVFFLVPEIKFVPSLLQSVSQGKDYLKSQFVNEAHVEARVKQIQDKYSVKRLDDLAPIKRGDLIQVEADSDVNKSFKGAPQKAVWHLVPEKLPEIMIEALVGHQVGQMLIVPLPRPLDDKSSPARMTIKIIERTVIESVSLEKVAELEGLRDVQVLYDRERRELEAHYEKEKVNLLFNLLSHNMQMSPIPAAFVYDLAQMRVEVMKHEMGEKQFGLKYGRDTDTVMSKFLMVAEREARELFLSWSLCRDLKRLPTTDDLKKYIECEKLDSDDEDAKIFARLLLCKERVLQDFCGIEPPMRSILELPSSKIVRGGIKINQ